MSEKKNYKDTLNLPKTDFDMRANLLKKEPAMQQRWKEQDLDARIRAARADAPKFVLHDGPPYANGDIHMGHALNKTLKDMVLRIKNMTGHNAPMIHGWDCHGQPIEQKIVEKLGEKMQQMDRTTIRRLCREYAEKFVDVQSQQIQRLGVVGDFETPYITMDPQYEADTLEVFAKLIEQGVVFKQLKPVHWSVENRTALADAELEYHDREDQSIYVAFEIADGADALPEHEGPAYLLIWTTTPWTLPANRAVAVHPDLQYALVRANTPAGPATVIVAEPRLEALRAAAGEWLGQAEVQATLRGSELVEAKPSYRQPLEETVTCPVVTANYVTLEDGTGLVHTAPGHGTEDYFTGLNHGLEVFCPVQADGTFDDTAPPFIRGRSVWDANEMIVEHLRQAGRLAAAETIRHSYPHDWRSKTPTIFRATEQWFIGVDKPLNSTGKTLREMAIEAVTRDDGQPEGALRFIPEWGRNRMLGMLESRPDWCISRQRNWGLPIPAFYGETGKPLCTAASVRAVAGVIREKGSDAWYTLSPADLLAGYDPQQDPDVESPGDFAPEKLEKGYDIFDVWFESGSSWNAVALARGLADEVPVDLYLEGSDQHRGWFQLSMLPCLGATAMPPFRTVLTHGFVVTEDGHKMSKSLGNAIDVLEQLSKRGADILRLWVASQNYQDDVRCSENLIAQAEDAYRKIRNTLRFCMGSLFDFDPAKTVEPGEHSIDLWMRMRLHELVRDVREAFEGYEFHKATRQIYEFCTVEASSVYLSAVKDRLYCDAPDSPRRRATQGVLHEMLLTLTKLLAPILPHTAEEAWGHIPARGQDEPESVHLALLPERDRTVLDLAEDFRPVPVDELTSEGIRIKAGPAWVWERLMDIRGDALVKLEALRNAGVKNPLEAEVVFHVPAEHPGLRSFVETYLGELEDMLGVGFARIETGPVGDASNGLVGVEVIDTREKYPRCARSWKRRPDVGTDADYPDLSARDAAAMKEIQG